MRRADLVVLGAGPAGLAAAWVASRAGHSVVLLERLDVVGGMSGSFDVAGTRVDFGSHRLHPSIDPRILSDLQGLLGRDLQLRRRHGRLHVAHRWVGFPLRPRELVSALPPSWLARMGLEALAMPLRRRDDTSYAATLRSGLGPTLYDALYRPYAVKLWGLPGEQIDAEQARRRVTADTPWKIAARIVRATRPGRRAAGQGHVFRYPARGFGQIAEALADAATAAGADLRLGTSVTAVAAESDHVRVTLDDGNVIEAGHVFTTIPLPALARITTPKPRPEAVEAASRLRFRAMVLCYVVHDGRPWTEYDAHYVPDPWTPVSRLSEPSNYRDSPHDPASTTVVCAELPCAPDDPVWSADDHELQATVTDAVSRLGLPPLRPVGVQVRRLRHVYPVYDIGYQQRLAGIDAWADALPRVTTLGRLGLFAHDNSHHALAMAYAAVEALGDGSFDPSVWATARRRFADHVVED